MPDVIIKGMEMPSGCRACKLNNDTICALINGCVYDETDGSTRRPDCPLNPAPEREQPITSNADRIRAMSDEELAEYLIRDVEAEAIRRAGRYLTNIEIDRAVVACLDWLKQEVKRDEP